MHPASSRAGRFISLRVRLAIALIVFCLDATLAVGLLLGGEIDEELRRRLDATEPGESISAIFVLHDRVDVGALKRSLSLQRVSREDRHYTVTSVLKERAHQSQASFLGEIESLIDMGFVDGYKPYWISNLVTVGGTREAIERLANRPEVSHAEWNFESGLIEPVDLGSPIDRSNLGRPASDDPIGRGQGVPPGIRAIRADRVWYELGVTGEGTILACLDTGVDGSHTALQGRWRGTVADAEECWYDVTDRTSVYPHDTHGHGTHVMGTMAGLSPETGDSIGIAYDAHWIAANGISPRVVGSEFSNFIFDCYEWFADPDGDPSTHDDVPDVVQNSWGVTPGDVDGTFQICDSRWWEVIDNCEAAGVVVTFSAGNSGPLPATMISPADRASTPYKNFSVGAIKATNELWPYPIALFSSRGPTSCLPGRETKPEVVAPGVDVFSAWTGGPGTYREASGTSMAGPHVAGVVGLMRQANPDLPVEDVKRILMETARPYGFEDNTYGFGLIDAYDAVLAAAAFGGAGRIAGSIVDATDSKGPVADAVIRLKESETILRSSTKGRFGGFVELGTYTVEVSHHLLETQTQSEVEIVPGEPVELAFSLADRSGPWVEAVQVRNAIPTVADSIEVAAEVEDFTGVWRVDLIARASGGSWESHEMVEASEGRFVAYLHPEKFGERYEYYFDTVDEIGNLRTYPDAGASAPEGFELLRSVFHDDFETDAGWSVVTEGDTRYGKWYRHDPFGTEYFNRPVSPEDDHSPGGVACYVTGKGKRAVEVDRSDVDDGCVTLTSPSIDVYGLLDATLSYWRWFAVDGPRKSGTFESEISFDGGESWVSLETMDTGEPSWTEQRFELAAMADLAVQDSVQVRFVVCDIDEDSYVEGAIDDVWIRGPVDPASIEEPFSEEMPVRVQPNPFRGGEAVLRFQLPHEQPVVIDLYDPTGRLVRRVFEGDAVAGDNQVSWDGRDAGGRAVSSGVYLYRVESESLRRQGKLLVVR